MLKTLIYMSCLFLAIRSVEPGRLFSLQEQIDHKINFIEQELQDIEIPIVLVGHSIGSYMCLELFKISQEKVIYCTCPYPFLALNTVSSQSAIRKLAASPALCVSLSSSGNLLGMLPAQISRFLVKISVGKSWSSSAVQDLCTYVLKVEFILWVAQHVSNLIKNHLQNAKNC